MGKITLAIISSTSYNPWYNLALEDLLLRQIQQNQVVLYLWRNKKTVVVGRNQNPWRECRCELLEGEGGRLARRLSGGGAVYHDLGNLNFTFIMSPNLFNIAQHFQIILQSVEELGVRGAYFAGRNDLLIAGKKFSGSAYYQSSNGAYHHGTILISTNLAQMARYLQVSREKMISRGIKSVPSRVINLSDVSNGLTVAAVKQSLAESFQRFYRLTADELHEGQVLKYDRPLFDMLHKKYASWAWRYGESPDFNIVYEHRFPWGEVEIKLHVVNGLITRAMVYSDALEVDLIRAVAAILKGLPLQKATIFDALDTIPILDGNQNIVQDLQTWISLKLYQHAIGGYNGE